MDAKPSTKANNVTEDRAIPSAPEFRVITHQGTRYAMRLEPVFWKVLELAAQNRTLRLSAYLGSILKGAVGQNNRASVARVHAVDWLSRRLLESATQGVSSKTLEAISALSPEPVFCINREGKFTAFNTAFRELMSRLSEDATSDAKPDLSVVFTRDLETIRAATQHSRDRILNEQIILKCGPTKTVKSALMTSLESPTGQHAGFYVRIV